MTCMLIINGIIFASLKSLSSKVYINILIPFSGLIPIINFVFGFGYFCISILNKSDAAVIIFLIFGFIPSFIFIFLTTT